MTSYESDESVPSAVSSESVQVSLIKALFARQQTVH